MPPTVAVSRAARSTPNTRPAAFAACCTRGQGGPGTDLDAALDGVDIAERAQPFGGQQHVVVLGNGAGHQRGSAALHGDVRPGVAAHPQHLGDLLGRTRPHQRTGPAPIAAGVVDAAPGQHVGVGDDVVRSDDIFQVRKAAWHARGYSTSRRGANTAFAPADRKWFCRWAFVMVPHCSHRPCHTSPRRLSTRHPVRRRRRRSLAAPRRCPSRGRE